MTILPQILEISGGLGAQILGHITFKYMQSLTNTLIDISYFDQEPTHSTPSRGVSIWPWHLHAYGIEYKQTEVAGKISSSLIRKLSKKGLSNKYFFDGSNKKSIMMLEALRNYDFLETDFPISKKRLDEVKNLTNY